MGFEAVAITGSAPGLCDTAMLIGKEPGQGDFFKVLRSGIENVTLYTIEELDEEVKLGNACRLSKAVDVSGKDIAFYLKDEFLKKFREICRKDFPWPEGKGIIRVSFEDQKTQTIIAPEDKIQEIRDHAGEWILEAVDSLGIQILPKISISDPESLNDLYKLEDLARFGAFCVGPQSVPLFFEFYQRIGLSLTLRTKKVTSLDEVYRFELQPFFPTISWDVFQYYIQCTCDVLWNKARFQRQSNSYNREEQIITEQEIKEEQKLVVNIPADQAREILAIHEAMQFLSSPVSSLMN